MDTLTERMNGLTERMDQLIARIDAFVEATGDRFNRVEGRLGNLESWRFEFQYRDNPMAHLARWMRRARRIFPADLDAVFAAYQAGRISAEEWTDLHRIDLLASGERLDQPGDLTVAIELSLTVDVSDVARASRRAKALTRAGIDTIAAVDGERITYDARTLADETGVLVFVDPTEESAA